MFVKKRDTPEKRTERAIINGLSMLGFHVTKLSQPQRAIMTAGVPDLYVRHPRWVLRIWLEVKAPSHRTAKFGGLSVDQIQWIAHERACGGTVIVAYSLSDAIEGLKQAGAPITT